MSGVLTQKEILEKGGKNNERSNYRMLLFYRALSLIQDFWNYLFKVPLVVIT